MTFDYLKNTKRIDKFPSGGKCKICGFEFSVDEYGSRVESSMRFSDVCGQHSCRMAAGVCDCKACKPKRELTEWEMLHGVDSEPEPLIEVCSSCDGMGIVKTGEFVAAH